VLAPQLFRHTFAVSYLMNGGDLMSLRLIVGHSTLMVTEMYLHLADAHIQVQHNKYSPVDRLGIGLTKRGRSFEKRQETGDKGEQTEGVVAAPPLAGRSR
jgi:hypothetical protein